MKRVGRGIGAAGAVVAAVAMMAGPAAAAPGQGNGLDVDIFVCNGQEVSVVHSQGAASFVLGGVYVLTSFTGTMPDGTVVYSKTWGNRNGAGTPIHCTADSNGLTIDVTAVPVGPAKT